MKRLIPAIVLIPLIYLYVMKLPSGYYAALLAVVSIIAQLEFYRMYKLKGPLKLTAILLGIAIIITAYLAEGFLPDVLIFSFIAVTALRLIIKRDPGSSLYEIAPAIVGLIYIPLLLSLQINLRRHGPEWIIFLFGSIWASDSLAYYIGKGIGKRKLYKEVSPNKTLEGAFGSIIGGIGGAVLLRVLFKIPLSPVITVMAGAVIGIASIIGDLVESMFKRDRAVKDSGSIIPGGHGGLLDKLDSALFAGPALYWLLTALRAIGG